MFTASTPIFMNEKKTFFGKKIRIGYVLKSADVGTLFSRRISENSLKIHPTHMHTPMHIRAPPFCPLPPTPMHTYAPPPAHPRTPIHTREHLPTPVHTHPHLHTPGHTHAQPCSPHTYPLMPADALNLINHMKLHVNGKMADDR